MLSIKSSKIGTREKPCSSRKYAASVRLVFAGSAAMSGRGVIASRTMRSPMVMMPPDHLAFLVFERVGLMLDQHLDVGRLRRDLGVAASEPGDQSRGSLEQGGWPEENGVEQVDGGNEVQGEGFGPGRGEPSRDGVNQCRNEG